RGHFPNGRGSGRLCRPRSTPRSAANEVARGPRKRSSRDQRFHAQKQHSARCAGRHAKPLKFRAGARFIVPLLGTMPSFGHRFFLIGILAEEQFNVQTRSQSSFPNAKGDSATPYLLDRDAAASPTRPPQKSLHNRYPARRLCQSAVRTAKNTSARAGLFLRSIDSA